MNAAVSRNSGETLLITGGHLLDPSQGLDASGDLLIVGNRIMAVGDAVRRHLPTTGYQELSARGMVVCPGFIDLHCHLREPGFEDRETITTGTRAAAHGGFTTVCAMPNTNPPIDSRATVDFIRQKAQAEGVIRVLSIGCITRGQQGKELAEMGELAEAGVVGFSDDGHPVSDASLMRHALEYGRAFGLPIIEHCEERALTQGSSMNEGWVATRLGLKGMPAAAEECMVMRDIALAQLTRGRLHIVHASTAGTVDFLRRAKEKGIEVTTEVTPHHLLLPEERVLGWAALGDLPWAPRDKRSFPYDTNAKMNPPLRAKADVKALVAALKEGVIDIVATDHAPHTLVDKLCEFDTAAFGVVGLETALGGLMTLVHQGELSLALLVSRLACDPGRLLATGAGEPFLGTLRLGAPGDVTLIDPDAEWEVDPNGFFSKGRNTPFAGCVFKGKVQATVAGGRLVYRDKAVSLEKKPGAAGDGS